MFTRIYYLRETRYTRASQVFSQRSLSNLLTTVRLTETHTCLNCYTRSDYSLVCRPPHDSRAHWRSQGPSGHPYNTEKGLIDGERRRTGPSATIYIKRAKTQKNNIEALLDLVIFSAVWGKKIRGVTMVG